MGEKIIFYHDLKKGDKFIHNYELCEKVEQTSSDSSSSYKVLGDATLADAEVYPVIESL